MKKLRTAKPYVFKFSLLQSLVLLIAFLTVSSQNIAKANVVTDWNTIAAADGPFLAHCCSSDNLAENYANRSVTSSDLPEWVLQPIELPGFPEGFYNCTFAENPIIIVDFHPDRICWERDTGHSVSLPTGVGEIFREQFRRFHINSLAACGFGPGDIAATRLGVRDENGSPVPGADTPCGTTGGKGGALCTSTLVISCGM